MALAVPGERLGVWAAERFPGEAASVRQARDFVRVVLGADWPGLDDVLLMVSEIASNAVRHTASGDNGWFDLTVSVAGSTARVQIADGGASSEPQIPGDGGGLGALTCGRGLRIVDALADRWGHTGDELGRVVWFEITGKPASDGAGSTRLFPERDVTAWLARQ
jgi:hypothetical protein